MNQQALTRVISITSGKGGVGKTTSTVNLALALAEKGQSVLILDADLGLANIDVQLGVTPKYTLLDLFEGTRELREIIIDAPGGISLIPAASGVEKLASLTTEERLLLMQAVEDVAQHYDYLLIDTQAGIGPEVLNFCSAASEIVCVVKDEPTSLTDAYALIKVLSQSYGEHQINILVNEVQGEKEARMVFERLERAIARFLHVTIRYLGWVPVDGAVREAVRQQKGVVSLYPSSKAAGAYRGIAESFESNFINLRVKGGMQFFFRRILELQTS